MENTTIVFLVLCICILISSSISSGIGAWLYISMPTEIVASTVTPTAIPNVTPTATPTLGVGPTPAVGLTPLEKKCTADNSGWLPKVVSVGEKTTKACSGGGSETATCGADGNWASFTGCPLAPALDNYKILENADYPGNDIKCYTDDKKSEECAKLCNANDSCVGFIEIPKGSIWGDTSGCCIKNKFGKKSTATGANFHYKKDQTLPIDLKPYPIEKFGFGLLLGKTPCINNSDAVSRGYTSRDDAAYGSCIEAGHSGWIESAACGNKINGEDTYLYICNWKK